MNLFNLILLISLSIVGEYLRNSPMKNEYIPCILTCISTSICIFGYLIKIFSHGFTFYLNNIVNSIINGIIIAALTIYINQLYKQKEKMNR